MKSISLFVLLFVTGCALIRVPETVSYTKTDNPFALEASRSYLPQDIRPVPAYTIYEGSKWQCKEKTTAGDSVCCLDSFGTMSPWKYCLLVDEDMNGFAFIEPGTSEFTRWSEGKQRLFKKVE